jgi:prepilin-type N-terminal cleavage/methylation domain-containing protein
LNVRASRRSAFTLVELLVVIAIIAILVSISIAAVMKTVQVRQRSLTQSSINSLYVALMSHQKAVIDNAKQQPSKYGQGTPAFNLAGGDPHRAQVLYIKGCLKAQFPMTYAEAITGAPAVGVPGEPAYQRLLGSTTSKNPASESAACLLMALTAVDRRGVNVSKDFMGSLQIQDSDGDGIKEIVDMWGHPVVFVRWPMPADATVADGNYNMMKSWDTAYLTEKFHDPQDPLGTLLASTTGGAANWSGVGTFTGSFHPLTTAPYYGTAPYDGKGFYCVPVIISAGQDGVLGFSNWSPANPLDISVNSAQKAPGYTDNIYSDPTKVTP